MVRLITHNLLACPAKNCSFPANFPLAFTNINNIAITQSDFNSTFLRSFLPRIEYTALRKSALEVIHPSPLLQLTPSLQLGNTDLPLQEPDFSNPQAVSEHLLKILHHVLLEVPTFPAPTRAARVPPN